jgi:hypothetical protein
MSPLFPARRAERFDQLVEGGRRDDAAGSVDPATAELLELVSALQAAPRPEPRPAFVADLRAQLLAAAETELVPVAARDRSDVARLTITPRKGRRERRVGVALGAAAILGATTSMAVASQGALPGDTLYPLKRAIENTHTGISVGDDAKGRTMLGNATDRLDEVRELSSRPDPDADLVAHTLTTFSDQAGEAGDHLIKDFQENGDQSAIKQLDQFTHQSVATLSDLDALIPAGAHDALVDAAAVVMSLDATATNLCPTCGEPITDLPAQLMAGGTDAVDDATDALTEAGEQLVPPTPDPTLSDGGKDAVSGIDPPTDPVQVPPVVPTPTVTPTGGGGLQDVVPTPPGGGDGGGKGDGGKGGKGGKLDTGTPTAPVDLSPVTDTVNEVVSGVVESVGGLLGGLTGGLVGGGTGGTGSGQQQP